ncbi:hypothetical protein [cyanobacterium endosymbiont of Epithemia clementina EcSB]|uniref:hypothetical protein n=1 Tax=cyanobacterium endosymbiont of Epithemia clementina EcSB TaxID=3034674 RepID=UPI00247FD138|nr:hypothetical protein [cyanobacterium endosymbiont of Epithemia clementina EcSB]WGT68192.1 hypothetical protein P3F56_03775 [cyanobacterium endosymbiont of Epithemia clementina EcSB]
MKTSIIRQLWSIVEESSAKTLVNLDDSDLVSQLLKKLDAQYSLSSEDLQVMKVYFRSKTVLIRDIAHSRLENFFD